MQTSIVKLPENQIHFVIFLPLSCINVSTVKLFNYAFLGKQNFSTRIFGTSGSNKLLTILHCHFLHVNIKTYISIEGKYIDIYIYINFIAEIFMSI